MKKIALATSLAEPDLQPGEVRLAAELARRGMAAKGHPWNGPFAPFAEADLVVVRSTWDYPEHVEAFRGWIERLGKDARRVFNPPALMLWNLSKTYLLDLAAKGAPLPATRVVAPDGAAIARAMAEMDLPEAIVKPLIGATSRGLSRVRRGDAAGCEAAAGELRQSGMVQAFIPEIAERGETSFVFLAGRYSHGVVKRPARGDIRSQQEFGATIEAVSPEPWAISAAAGVHALLPAPAFYARIDAVLLDGALALMEVEVIEPELFLTHEEGAAGRFADAIAEELNC